MMKTLVSNAIGFGAILLSVSMSLVVFQLPSNARLTSNTILADQGMLNKLVKDILVLQKDLNYFAKANNNINIDDSETASSVIDDMSLYLANINHLYDLLTVISIMTIDSERVQVVKLVHTLIVSIDNDIPPTITIIASEMSRTRSPALVSYCNQAKVELRKCQELLKRIDSETK